MPAEQREVDARDQELRDGEADRVDEVGARAEPPEHELGDRAHLGAVVERHHHDAEEQHRRHRTDPEVVHGRQPDLRTVGRHAHDLDRTQVGRDEGQTGHPGRERSPGEEEVDRVGDRTPGHDTDAEHEGEVDGDEQVVEPRRIDQRRHGRELRSQREPPEARWTAHQPRRPTRPSAPLRGWSARACRDARSDAHDETMTPENDLQHLRRAIAVSSDARANGNHPFGATLVDAAGAIVLEAGTPSPRGTT